MASGPAPLSTSSSPDPLTIPTTVPPPPQIKNPNFFSSDPSPPPPPQPFPASSHSSGDHPVVSAPLPPPSSASVPDPKHRFSSSSAQPSPPPSTHTSLPHIVPSSAPLFGHQHSSAPTGSAPIPTQKSYAQAARSGRGPGFVRAHANDVESFARIPRTGANIICGSRDGMPSFSFVSSDLPKVEDIYSNALVMKFSGGRPSLEASHREILSWGMKQQFSIGPLSSRAFLLRFQDNNDLLKVLTRPSSMLITFPYKVFRWHNLSHLTEDSCLAPVWISFPRLPLQCFIPEFLESVANKLGRFLCFDKATTTLARPSAARICVELDLRKPPPPFIWIGLFDGFKQPVIYDRMPKYCNGCHRLGHSSVECSKICNELLPAHAMERDPNLQSRPPPVRRIAPGSRPASNHRSNTTKMAPTCDIASTSTNAPPAPIPPPTEIVQDMRPVNQNTLNEADQLHQQSMVSTLSEGTSKQTAPQPNSSMAQVQTSHHKRRHKKKSVRFDLSSGHPQTNLQANKDF